MQPFLEGLSVRNRKPRCFCTAKVEAHHAIIPTTKAVSLANLSREEQNIYRAVVCFYVIQFLDDAVYDKTVIELSVCGEKFTAGGRTAIDIGYKKLLIAFNLLKDDGDKGGSDQKDELQQSLPPVKEGEKAQAANPEISNKMTSPPAHFTEATLLAAMEHIAKYVTEEKFKKILKETAGIGTPATRAAILESAINHKYLTRKGKNILSTDKAKTVIPSLPGGIKSAGLTAAWEQELDKIAHSQSDLNEFILNIEKWIRSIIQKYVQDGVFKLNGYSKIPEPTSVQPVSCNMSKPVRSASENLSSDVPKCPKCQRAMVRRKSSKTGNEFWGCSGFPKCREIINIASDESAGNRAVEKRSKRPSK
jgi:DNA topoisomerase-3